MTGVFIESADIDVEDGEQFVFVSKLIPDFKFISEQEGNVKLITKTRNFPGDSLSQKF